MTETSRATRNMYEVILRQLIVLVAVLVVGGAVVGHLLAGAPGVWGALMGAGIAALFTVGTVVTMMLTADRPVHVMSAAGVGGWIIKMFLLFVVLVLVKDRDFYDPQVFFVVLALAVLGSLVIEMRALLRARIPTVEPAPRDGDLDRPDDGGNRPPAGHV